ncbi:neutral zinc metallopeptidase [Rhizohabitans arisaemae]|uniref:neutral zinc metallopeptidase n=1 Tax=Rhizohabitans arisaemae TaxID=2720610 RepID=UPI0024B1EB63|nr:neutral zinc metallopeptidase [Rhizohabitans arisaemae]
MVATLALVLTAGPVANAEASGRTREETKNTATAAPPPTGRAAAVASPLYRTGRLAVTACAPGKIKSGSAASYRRFMTSLTRCLDRAWARQFKSAGLPFAKPGLRFLTRPAATPCGKWPKGATGIYCSAGRTIYIWVDARSVREAFELGQAQFMAHEYAHHVQELGGILGYYWSRQNGVGKSAKLALSRRFELQADCLAGAFLGAAEAALPVNRLEWESTVDWTRQNGHKGWPVNDHGKGATQAYWLTHGFGAASPTACNTWTVAASKVA